MNTSALRDRLSDWQQRFQSLFGPRAQVCTYNAQKKRDNGDNGIYMFCRL